MVFFEHILFIISKFSVICQNTFLRHMFGSMSGIPRKCNNMNNNVSLLFDLF